jgi:glycosyltransferase involved in cell wall biosynthesis
MRILQLIDSLETGGAERMAVNYANALVAEVSFSGLVASRKEGGLLTQLDSKVEYLFLNRTGTFDIKAILKLREYIKVHNISIIHAHSTSFFLAVLMKVVGLKVKIVWHDHYGNSEFLEKRKNTILKISSLFFNKIITVNELLTKWGSKNLYCNNIKYFPNFVFFEKEVEKITLKGMSDKRILCLANLRPQKNHVMLIDVAKKIKTTFPDWSFHLIGKDFNDTYSSEIYKKIINENLEGTVFIYPATNAVASAIKQSSIGVLTSVSEGLPVSLLEYGYFGLPTIATAVGDISSVLHTDNGILIKSLDTVSFVQAIEKVITDINYRNLIGMQLKKEIHLNYTKEAVIINYIKFLSDEE